MAIISKTSTQWAALPNHVLPLNDTGYETDTYRRKIGDGVSKWKDLDYVALIQLRGDTKANWSAKNPVIGKREKVVETDTNREKIGDGIKRYSELKYTDQDLVDKTVQLEQGEAKSSNVAQIKSFTVTESLSFKHPVGSVTFALGFFLEQNNISIKFKADAWDVFQVWHSNGRYLFSYQGISVELPFTTGYNCILISYSRSKMMIIANGMLLKNHDIQLDATNNVLIGGVKSNYIGLSSSVVSDVNLAYRINNDIVNCLLSPLFDIANISKLGYYRDLLHDYNGNVVNTSSVDLEKAQSENKSTGNLLMASGDILFDRLDDWLLAFDFIFSGERVGVSMYNMDTLIGDFSISQEGALLLNLSRGFNIRAKIGKNTLVVQKNKGSVCVYCNNNFIGEVNLDSNTFRLSRLRLNNAVLQKVGISKNAVNESILKDLSVNIYDVFDFKFLCAEANGLIDIRSGMLLNMSYKNTISAFNRATSSDLKMYERINKSTINTYRKNKNKACVSFVDDDGLLAVKTDLYPFMSARNVPFATAIVGDNIDTNTRYLSSNDIIKLSNDGVEILSHNWLHNDLSKFPIEQQLSEIRKGKAILDSLGCTPFAFVLPYGGYNQDTIDAISAMYDCCIHYGSDDINKIGTLRNYYIKRVSFDRPSSGNSYVDRLNYYKTFVDNADREKAWLVFATHAQSFEWAEDSFQLLDELIAYIKSKNIEITLPSEGFRRFGNIAESESGKKITATLDIV